MTQMETQPHIDSSRIAEVARGLDRAEIEGREKVFSVRDLAVSYSGKVALQDVDLDVHRNTVTAFIGPSGCGKSTFIRCFNRMNDLIPGAVVKGEMLYHGLDLYGPKVDPVEVRKCIGMVFQKPNPFPKSIYDNVAFGPRVLGRKDNLDGRVERALRQAALLFYKSNISRRSCRKPCWPQQNRSQSACAACAVEFSLPGTIPTAKSQRRSVDRRNGF